MDAADSGSEADASVSNTPRKRQSRRRKEQESARTSRQEEDRESLLSTPVWVTITNVEEHRDERKLYYIYDIEVLFGPHEWTVKKRYSQFRALHLTLLQHPSLEKLQEGVHAMVLPEFPPKKILRSLKVTQRRRKDLQSYIRSLIYILYSFGPCTDLRSYVLDIRRVLFEFLDNPHRILVSNFVLEAGDPIPDIGGVGSTPSTSVASYVQPTSPGMSDTSGSTTLHGPSILDEEDKRAKEEANENVRFFLFKSVQDLEKRCSTLQEERDSFFHAYKHLDQKRNALKARADEVTTIINKLFDCDVSKIAADSREQAVAAIKHSDGSAALATSPLASSLGSVASPKQPPRPLTMEECLRVSNDNLRSLERELKVLRSRDIGDGDVGRLLCDLALRLLTQVKNVNEYQGELIRRAAQKESAFDEEFSGSGGYRSSVHERPSAHMKPPTPTKKTKKGKRGKGLSDVSEIDSGTDCSGWGYGTEEGLEDVMPRESLVEHCKKLKEDLNSARSDIEDLQTRRKADGQVKTHLVQRIRELEQEVQDARAINEANGKEKVQEVVSRLRSLENKFKRVHKAPLVPSEAEVTKVLAAQKI